MAVNTEALAEEPGLNVESVSGFAVTVHFTYLNVVNRYFQGIFKVILEGCSNI
jgi:hypothetical protein